MFRPIFNLVQKLRMCGAIPPLPLYALTAYNGTSILISCVLGWDATSVDEHFATFWRIVMSSCSGPNRPRWTPVWIPHIAALLIGLFSWFALR